MSKIDDGGPAFPEAVAVGPTGDVYPGMGGMSLRDYLTANAPQVPGDYYFPGYPLCPHYPSIPAGLTGEAYNEAARKAADEYDEIQRQWNADVRAFVLRREVSWRYAYADAMLAARSKDRSEP